MNRSLLAIAAAALFATPALAGSYSATPANPAEGRIIARDVVWTCGPAACQGATEESRPIVLCQGLAKRAGRLKNFVANGRAFGPAELERCNAAAKESGDRTVAESR